MSAITPQRRRRLALAGTLAWSGSILMLAWWGPTPGTPAAPPQGAQGVPSVEDAIR